MRRGFTLVEVLIVLAICVIIVALLGYAIFSFNSAASDDARSEVENKQTTVVINSTKITTFESDGHKWVLARYLEGVDLEHHPDCPCKAK